MGNGCRVTCVVNSLAAGGAERAMTWLSSALAGAGYRVSLLTIFPEDHDHYRAGAGVARLVAPAAVTRTFAWYDVSAVAARLLALRRAILSTAPDVVISFVSTLNVQVLLALLGCRVPVIASERVHPPMHDIGMRWDALRSVVYPHSAAIVVQTAATAEWARARWPRVRVIPNAAIPPGDESGARPDWFGPLNVVSMGRLVAQKNHALLLRSFSRLASANPDWHLTIVGEGPERRSLEQLAESLGVRRRVHLPGVVEDPWSRLRHADVFVLSSDFEGFPNALLEAMAHGLPVVSTDCPAGPAEIVRHRVDGILVPAGDVDALSAELGVLLADVEARQRLGARATEVCERFAPASVLREWCSVIEDARAV